MGIFNTKEDEYETQLQLKHIHTHINHSSDVLLSRRTEHFV